MRFEGPPKNGGVISDLPDRTDESMTGDTPFLGRRAGEPLADGGLSPAAGRDRRGPTAVLRSVSKPDLRLASNGTLLNMKFLPVFFDGAQALDKFVSLLRGFSQLGIPYNHARHPTDTHMTNVTSGSDLRHYGQQLTKRIILCRLRSTD